MEKGKIELPLYLGKKVQERLREKYGMEVDDRFFTKEQLELVDEITIVPPLEGGLKGLEHLSNLKKLEVESIGNTSFQTDQIPSMSNKDMDNIAQCKNLKELSIVNQTKVECLDCKQLSGLTVLEIKNNRKLKEIKGLECLRSLEKFSCYGNENLIGIENLDQVIIHNPELYATELDILLCPDAIGYKSDEDSFNFEAVKCLENIDKKSHANFVEYMQKKQVNISYSKMMELHQKSQDILKQNNIKGNNSDIIMAIENYIVQNIRYNNSVQKENYNEQKPVVGARSTANGVYSAVINGQCNSEGYTRTMQYLLKLNCIKSSIVYCESKEKIQGIEEPYHSILCLENKDVYCDPCGNAIAYTQGDKSMPFHLKERNEMEQYYSFDQIHRVMEVSNNFFKELGARIGKVKEIEKEIHKSLSFEKEETKEEGGKIHERTKYGV